MRTFRTDTTLIIVLDDHDWKYFKPGCFAFIEALKNRIAPTEREYNPLNKEWAVAVKHAALVEQLKDEHLVDKNQGSLF